MPAPPTSPLAPAPRRLPPAGHPASLPVALLLAVRQLADPRVLRILGKSLLVTLALFAALAWGGWTLLDGGLRRAGLADTLFAGAGDLRQLAAGLLVGIGLWLGWRIVAMAVIQFFADEVVEAVEARHYPAVAAAARAVPLRRQAAAGLKAAARALLARALLGALGAVVLLAVAMLPGAATAASGGALFPGSTPEPQATAEATPAAAISANRDDGEDERIGARISGIMAEVPSLSQVTASVQEGVVTLRGTVADAEARNRAEAIAARVQGVVTIENLIERDPSLNAGQELAGLSDRVAGWARLLPLVGAAVLVALLIAGLGYALASLTGLWRRLAPNPFMAELIASAVRFLFVVAGLVIALDMMGAGTLLGAVLGGAGVIGVALGFAMRDTIENYVASLMLSLRQPFRANDLVVIDGQEGRVIRLTSRATILMTLDGNHLRIPNSAVFKAVILNYTRNPQRRFEFDLGIDAEDDPTAARHLGVQVLAALGFVLDHPEPQARVMEVGDSNIVIRFLGWIDQRETDWFKARSRAIPAVKQALEEAGFALPEPIYRLRFDAAGRRALGRLAEAGTGESAEGEPAPPIRRPVTPPAPAQDTRPESEVAKMVEEERATTSENDLLDSSRPVE